MSSTAATAQVLESLERATKGLRTVGSKLADVTPAEKREDVRREYDELAGQLTKRQELLKENSPSPLTQQDLSAEVGKFEMALSSNIIPSQNGLPDELKKPIRDVRTDLELNDRLLALSGNRPKDKQKAEAALRWFSQKKDAYLLDFLVEVSHYITESYTDEETTELLNLAYKGLINRGCEELLRFYSFNDAEMLQILQSTIANYGHMHPESLKDFYKAGSPTQVLEHLTEMQGILKEYVEEREIRRWLIAPNKLFDDRSPRMALLTGDTFKVYQFLVGLAHGVHI